MSKKFMQKIIKTDYIKIGEKTTICLLTLDNGFEVVGSSACVDPIMYDYTIGCKIAMDVAYDKVEELCGFLEQSKLTYLT